MKSLVRLALSVVTAAGAASSIASAQSVISAKSGVIHYSEGRVYLNDKQVETKFGEFPEVKENQQLRTEDGRVEVLLTPGVFLRLGENGAIRMISNRLIDTRVEVLSGEALIEADDLPKDNGITVVYKDYTVQLQKKGVYRFDSETSQMRVYDGEALVQRDGKNEEVKEGHALTMDGGMQIASFNRKDVDDLYRWGAHRSEYISMANVSAAKMVADSGSYWPSSSWYFNPYYGMYTFVPGFGYGMGYGAGAGMYYNPFGFTFWSPYTVYDYIGSLPYYGGGYYGPGNAGNRVVHTPVHRGVTPAAVAMRTSKASSFGRAAAGGGGFSHGGGTSAGSTGSFSTSSAHSGSFGNMSAGAGHSGGGGGHK